MISIVIPLYNKAHTITKTLGTVLNQTYRDFEVIIVNDGSTDNGLDVIHAFTNDSRIRIISQVNQGVSVARNVGVLHSRYDYVAFLDGDDEWKPTYLEVMSEAISAFGGAGMYCCAGTLRNGNSPESLRLYDKYKDQTLKIDFFQNPGIFLHTSATIVSKFIFYQTDGFPAGMKRNQDFALFFNIALISDVIYCGKPLSTYMGEVSGQATQISTSKVIAHIVSRFNHVHSIWEETDKSKKTYIIYTKYELRHFVISFLRDKDYESIEYFFNNLSPSILSLLLPYENIIYRSPWLNPISKIHILFTKLIWRFHGFGVVV